MVQWASWLRVLCVHAARAQIPSPFPAKCHTIPRVSPVLSMRLGEWLSQPTAPNGSSSSHFWQCEPILSFELWHSPSLSLS